MYGQKPCFSVVITLYKYLHATNTCTAEEGMHQFIQISPYYKYESDYMSG